MKKEFVKFGEFVKLFSSDQHFSVFSNPSQKILLFRGSRFELDSKREKIYSGICLYDVRKVEFESFSINLKDNEVREVLSVVVYLDFLVPFQKNFQKVAV